MFDYRFLQSILVVDVICLANNCFVLANSFSLFLKNSSELRDTLNVHARCNNYFISLAYDTKN